MERCPPQLAVGCHEEAGGRLNDGKRKGVPRMMGNGRLFDAGVLDEYRPRPYQCAAVGHVETAWASTSGARTLAIMATGTGKTEVAAELIRRSSEQGHGSLFIAPFIDLVAQTAARLRSRGVSCGVEQGPLRSAEGVTVACYASLLSRNRWQQFIGRVKRVIVDEVHLNFTAASMRMLDAFVEAGCDILGMTATPDRGGDPLTKWYGEVSVYYPYHAALDDGWLVPARIWMTVLEDLDLSAFKRRHGDFDAEELSRIMAQERTVQGIGSMVEQHHDGQPSVVFCQSIRQSEQLHRDLERRGIHASIVHSRMEGEERRLHLRDFEEGTTNVILNVGCLCTGWDSPQVCKVFIAKPTLSKSKYCQMFGRGVRPLPGVVDRFATPAARKAAVAHSEKPCFEVFDITDSSRLNDLRSAVDVIFPDEDAELLTRVRRRVEKRGGQVELDTVLEQERAAAAREQAARDALQEHLRGELVAHGRFSNYERSVYAEAERPARGRPGRRWYVMPFGKHKGRRFKDIPVSYLHWVLRECRLGDDLRDAIHDAVCARSN
jgi:superfamily II DNA or RNA helicase